MLSDLNRDGNLDLAATVTNSDDAFTNTVVVMLGNGDGSFEPAQEYVAAGRPNALAVADFNGDGIPDLVVGGQSSFAVLIGNGDGTFRGRILTQAKINLSWMTAADVNGDGKADLAVGSYTKRGVFIYLGEGDGTFQRPRKIATSVPLGVLKFVDMNGDSHPDLIGSGYLANTLVVLLGNATGTFAPPMNITFAGVPGKFTTDDFNGDGKADLAVSQGDPNFNTGQTTLLILLGHGDGTFRAPIAFGSIGDSIASGQLNADSALDLVGGGGLALSVQVAFGLGDGNFANRRDHAVGNVAADIATADMNHDGKLDLTVVTNYPNNTVTVLLGRGDGSFSAPVQYGVGQTTESSTGVAIEDLNGDGNKDLVVTSSFLCPRLG